MSNICLFQSCCWTTFCSGWWDFLPHLGVWANGTQGKNSTLGQTLNLSQGSIFGGCTLLQKLIFCPKKKLRQQATFLISRIFWYFRNFREIPHFFFTFGTFQFDFPALFETYELSRLISHNFWHLENFNLNFLALIFQFQRHSAFFTFGKFQFDFTALFETYQLSTSISRTLWHLGNFN